MGTHAVSGGHDRAANLDRERTRFRGRDRERDSSVTLRRRAGDGADDAAAPVARRLRGVRWPGCFVVPSEGSPKPTAANSLCHRRLGGCARALCQHARRSHTGTYSGREKVVHAPMDWVSSSLGPVPLQLPPEALFHLLVLCPPPCSSLSCSAAGLSRRSPVPAHISDAASFAVKGKNLLDIEP